MSAARAFNRSTAIRNSSILGARTARAARRLVIGIKRADAPTLTPSIRIALTDLKLDRLAVVYPGNKPYELGTQVSVIPLESIVAEGIDSLPPTRRRRSQAKEIAFNEVLARSQRKAPVDTDLILDLYEALFRPSVDAGITDSATSRPTPSPGVCNDSPVHGRQRPARRTTHESRTAQRRSPLTHHPQRRARVLPKGLMPTSPT
jgi:hypothetical protein